MAAKLVRAAVVVKKGPPGTQRMESKIAGLDVSYWLTERGDVTLDVRAVTARAPKEAQCISLYVDGNTDDFKSMIEWMYENREELAMRCVTARSLRVKGVTKNE